MIGLFESGFSPICIYYISTFYSRFDLAWRIGIFFALSAISGGFSGAIAYGILQVRGRLHSWQYLFIIEGVITIFFAFFCTLALPKKPSTAWMISKQDKEYIVRRELIEDSLSRLVKSTKQDFIELARDWKLWIILPFSIAGAVPIATFPVFLPLVLRGFGYTGNTANLMSVPPNICGVVGLLITTWSSDRTHDRGIHIISTLGVTLIGLILVVTITHNVARYACLCIMLLGAFSVTPLTSAWLAGNTPVPGKRVLVIGCAGWGYVSGILGAQIFRPKFAPRYLTPFYIVLALNIFAIIGYSGYQLLLRNVNRSRALKLASMTQAEIQAEEEGSERLGDKKYTFQYQI
ncbi:major facilitator superfamily domain-containing protein [Bisporella sp. PMI_857]|nr:major facilitator superfamily domain-containing protein [Bisporella sp. PMI_857]